MEGGQRQASGRAWDWEASQGGVEPPRSKVLRTGSSRWGVSIIGGQNARPCRTENYCPTTENLSEEYGDWMIRQNSNRGFSMTR
jgi:hypothetical protein